MTVVASSDQSILVAGSAFSQSLAAYNTADGQKLWQKWISSAPWGRPLSFGHQTYLNPHNGGTMALKLETGDLLWRLPRQTGAAQAPPVRLDKELLLRVSLDGLLTVFGRQGRVRESLRLPLEPRDRCPYPPAQQEDRVLLASRNGTIWQLRPENLRQHNSRQLKIPSRDFPSATQLVGPLAATESALYALTLEGSLLRLDSSYVDNGKIDWLVSLWSPDQLFGNSGAALSQILSDQKALYVAGSRETVAIDPSTGARRWRHRFSSTQNAALSGDGRGLALIGEKLLRILDQNDGSVLAEATLPSPPASAPIWQHDFVVVGFEDGKLRAFRLTPEKPPTSSSP